MPKRLYTHLSAEARKTVSLGLAQGQSLRRLARILGRAPSTLSREYARNTTRGHPYRPDPPGPGVFARADCRTSPTRVS